MVMLEAYLAFIRSLLESIPFNFFDYAVLIALAFYVFEDISFGAIASFIGLSSTLSSFFMGLALYPFISQILVRNLSLPKGIADAVAFMIAVSISFMVVSLILSAIRRRFLNMSLPSLVNKGGGAVFGLISFFFIASFAVSLLLSFPTSAVIKDQVRDSVTARFLFTRTQALDNTVKKIFGGAIEDTINFLTVKPGSTGTVPLNFKTTSYKLDRASEKKMLDAVNRQRESRGIAALTFDDSLAQVGRDHAKDMLERGYFSHYTPEGLSPFDRMEQAHIIYITAGENLAFAPDEEIAMDGLMKSPGHRENILSDDFGKVGIGVLDAGIYGKMFVQEFSD